MAEVAGMARRAMAQAAIHALRRDIARIEGILPEPMAAAAAPLRHTHDAGTDSRLSPWVATGAAGFDQALGGGLPAAALTEVHGAAGRDAGALTGFALALVRRLVDRRALRPLLWVAIGRRRPIWACPIRPALPGSSACRPKPCCWLRQPSSPMACGLRKRRRGCRHWRRSYSRSKAIRAVST